MFLIKKCKLYKINTFVGPKRVIILESQLLPRSLQKYLEERTDLAGCDDFTTKKGKSSLILNST